MSRWRLLTGTSTGSHTVPPEWCSHGVDVGQLHEGLEVLQRGVAAAVGQVAHEGGAVGGGEDDGVAADLDRAGRVAGQLRELARRGGAQRPHVAGIEADPGAVDGGPGVAEQTERDLVAADLDADVGQDPVGVRLDERQALLAEQLVDGDLAPEEGRRVGVARVLGPGLDPPCPTAAPGPPDGRGVGHGARLRGVRCRRAAAAGGARRRGCGSGWCGRARPRCWAARSSRTALR